MKGLFQKRLVGWLRQLKGLPFKPVDLSFVHRTYFKRPGLVSHVCNSTTGKAKKGGALAKLAYLTSSETTGDPVSKTKRVVPEKRHTLKPSLCPPTLSLCVFVLCEHTAVPL